MNLTITVDEEVLKRARIRAIEQNTSVNAVLRAFLTSYAGLRTGRRRAVGKLLKLSEQSVSAREGKAWTRDNLHKR